MWVSYKSTNFKQAHLWDVSIPTLGSQIPKCFNDSPCLLRYETPKGSSMIPQHPSDSSGPSGPVHDAPHQILVVVFQDAFRDDTEAVGQPEVHTVNPWSREFRKAWSDHHVQRPWVDVITNKWWTLTWNHGDVTILSPSSNQWIEDWIYFVFVLTWGTPPKMAILQRYNYQPIDSRYLRVSLFQDKPQTALLREYLCGGNN